MGGKSVRWTDEENQYLKDNAPDMTCKELSVGLVSISPVERSIENIRHHCTQIGVSPKSAGRHFWTNSEEKLLRENYYELGLKKTAKLLGIPKLVVERKVGKSTTMIEMERKTPWMGSMLETIDEVGKTIYELSVELFRAGELVEIQETDGKVALFARVRR